MEAGVGAWESIRTGTLIFHGPWYARVIFAEYVFFLYPKPPVAPRTTARLVCRSRAHVGGNRRLLLFRSFGGGGRSWGRRSIILVVVDDSVARAMHSSLHMRCLTSSRSGSVNPSLSWIAIAVATSYSFFFFRGAKSSLLLPRRQDA